MRPISLFIASSLDGFITGSNDSLEWLFTDQDYGYTAFFDAIDAVIMGHKTFDVAGTFEKDPVSRESQVCVHSPGPRTTFPTSSLLRQIQRSFVVSYG
jgi:dihydrofolate reductase